MKATYFFFYPIPPISYIGERGKNKTYRFKKRLVAAKMSRYVRSPGFGKLNGDEKWLENIVGNVGPVAVGIFASPNFQNYKTGKFVMSAYKLETIVANLKKNKLSMKVRNS